MFLQKIFNRRLPKGQVVWCLGLPYTKKTFLSCFGETVKSDFIDSLAFQYKSTDAEILWSYYEQTAEKIKEVVCFLKERNVDVVELKSVDQLKSAYSYSTIILTAHHHRILECLDFFCNTIRIEDIVNTIPEDYKGIVDISSCFSSTFQMKCKQKAIDATYIAAETESSVGLRLFIYKQTIRHLISHQQGNYLESFRVIIRRIIANSKQNEQGGKDVFLGGNNPYTYYTQDNRNYIQDKLFSSVFAPLETKRSDYMMVQVYLYKPGEEEAVANKAQEVDSNAERRNYISLAVKLKKGDKVKITLSALGKYVTIEDSTQEITWQGQLTDCQFAVWVDESFCASTLLGVVQLMVNGAPVGRMMFKTKVVDDNPRISYSNIECKRYHKIFISYSHEDEERVKYLAEAYKAQGVDYFFDRHYLKAGDVYPIKIKQYIDSADLFILCWSKNAAKSDYVNLERHQALALAYPQVNIQEASITIHPISIEPRAEYPEDMNKVYNFEEV